jgi:hypothetical protein
MAAKAPALVGPGTSLFAGRIGVARVDITPPVGIYARNWGAAAHDVGESIHRPLSITALTIRTGDGPPLVLTDADLGFWTSLDRFRSMRAEILEELSLDSSRFLFALTHTHASPHLCDPQPGMAGGELLDQWLRTLKPATIRAVHDALANEAESTLDWNRGRCQLAVTRDLPDPTCDGERRICGYNPGTPADNTLLLGRVCDANGTIRATIVNYACHPTTLAWSNTSLSPDYIGAMRETIEKNTGNAPALFLQGASGELSPRYQYVGDPAVADRHGRQLGFASLATLEDMEPPGTRLAFEGVVESGAPLAVWKPQPIEPSKMLAAAESAVALPLKPDLPSADELDRQFRACEDRALAERLRRKRNLRRVLGDSESFPLPIWAWRVGDAIFVGCMAEAYSVTQTSLREKFPEHHVICMNLINGTIGYLPPADTYDLNLYQVWQSPFARGCLERYIAALETLIRTLL